jgi:hypothetical protein
MGPRRQAARALCSMWSADVWMTRCGTRALASTSPVSDTATDFTEVVPMSMPTVIGTWSVAGVMMSAQLS